MRLKVTVAVGLFVITVLAYGFFENSRSTTTRRVTATERSQPTRAASSAAPVDQPLPVPERKMHTTDVMHKAATENFALYRTTNDAGTHRQSAAATVAPRPKPGQASAENDRDMASLPAEANDPGVVFAAPEANDPGTIFAAPEADDPGAPYPAPEFSELGNQY